MRKLKEIFIIGTCLLMWVVLLSAWTYTYDIATPLGSDAPSVLDDRDRETKAANQERQNIDHYWPLTGTEVSDANAGKHRQVTFQSSISTPTQVTDQAHLYMQTDDLWYQNDTDSAIQITNGGEIEYQSISDVNSDTYIVSVDDAGTGTANLIKADANDLACLADGAILAAKTESTDPNRTIVDLNYAKTGDTVMHDSEGGYQNADVDSTKTKVYTIYLTGTLDADSSTSVAHGVTGVDNILSVVAYAYNSAGAYYQVAEHYVDASAGATYIVSYDGTNVTLSGVGVNLRGQKYRIRIDYK